jgi:periplasmic divalent cation tolerance protein
MSGLKLILTYIDSEELAEKIANTLLSEKLVACVGYFPVKSRYWWKGKIAKNDKEFQLTIKTKENLVDETIEKIKQVHSYELPAIEVFSIEKANVGLKEWITEVCK